MVRVQFHNLKKSDALKDMIVEKVDHVVTKFPDLENATTTVTVSMENSQFQAGPDVFHVRILLLARGLRPLVLTKSAENPYLALSILSDRLFEVLHRAVERRRERSRSERRHWKGSPHLTHEQKAG